MEDIEQLELSEQQIKYNEEAKANCELYEVLNINQGKCMASQSIVSRFGGCDNPEGCLRHNNFIGGKK